MTIDNEGSTRVDEPRAATERTVAPVREETYLPVHEERPARADISVDAGRRDRVAWGAVWAGATTLLATFLLLELIFLSLGWLTPGGDNAPGLSSSQAWMTLLAGALAFGLGGLTAAASSRLRHISDGVLHGVVVWALAVTGILLLTLLGGSALFGAFSNVLGQLSVIQNAIGGGNVPAAQVESAVAGARNAASIAVLALGVFVGSSALGGALGAKLWPGRSDDAHDTEASGGRAIDLR